MAEVTRTPCSALSDDSSVQAAPVTVHWAYGGRWQPYSSGYRYCRSAVAKWLTVAQATVSKYPASTKHAPSASASVMVEHALYMPICGMLSERAT